MRILIILVLTVCGYGYAATEDTTNDAPDPAGYALDSLFSPKSNRALLAKMAMSATYKLNTNTNQPGWDNRLMNALWNHRGVQGVAIDSQNKTAKITFRSEETSVDQLFKFLKKKGFTPEIGE